MGREIAGSLRTNITLAAFVKWSRGLPPRHQAMIALGIFVFLIGLFGLVLSLFGWELLGANRVLLLVGGLFLIFSGIVLTQIGVRFALASRK